MAMLSNEEVVARLKAAKGRRREIARKSGVPYGTLNKWANGETRYPRGSGLDQLRLWFEREARAA